MTLCEIARAKLAADERPRVVISDELDVAAPWVGMFVRGRIKNPGVDTIEKVIKHYGGTITVTFDK